MSRIVSVWRPRWPIRQFLAAQARNPRQAASLDPKRPLVLTVDAAGGPRIAALNAIAEDAGLATGDLLADARAKAGARLQVRAADPAAANEALRRLALWATRYTPSVSVWGETNGADGFFLDVTGAAHLFGGEKRLLTDLAYRLQCFGLPARLALADTPGAGWAFTRFHPSPAVLSPGQDAKALASLPVEALRLGPDTCLALRRLGLKRIGALMDKPRGSLAARFPAELLYRLDQALGRVPEPLINLTPAPAYHKVRHLLEPIATQDAIVGIAGHLMQDLVPDLTQDGAGARSLRLVLYRVDGETSTLDLALALPTRNPAHVAHLIALRLERIVETFDAGFGFETISLSVMNAERMQDRQMDIAVLAETDTRERCAAFVDSLKQRLGPCSVRRLEPVASHIPERAEAACAAISETETWAIPDAPRPLFLLPRAEPAEVMALVPEGPPRRFRWRGVMHAVARTQGPERIASEWWRHRTPQPTRDYYLVENESGRRFWIYREGLYDRETTEPRWFVHGLFA